MSVVIAGELLFGFRNGSRYETTAASWTSSGESVRVSHARGSRDGRPLGRIASALKRKGRPLPTNDIWIAAQAMESGAELLSFDQHFAEVDGLAWVEPLEE